MSPNQYYHYRQLENPKGVGLPPRYRASGTASQGVQASVLNEMSYSTIASSYTHTPVIILFL